ncbi:MAG TPA: branched-chain amino acid ABC transporter permease [Actinomycetota bacterium]
MSLLTSRRPEALHTSYAQTTSIFPTRGSRIGMLLLAVVVVVLPFVLTDFWLAVINFAAIASIGAIGLNLLTGFTGQVSLGHAFFIGLGAYTAGYMGGNLGLPFVVWLPVAGILGGLVGLIVGPFALRLKGLYLAIVTLGLVFLGEHLFLNVRSVTGGPQGRSIPPPEVGGLSFNAIGTFSRDQSFYLLAIPMLALMTLIAKNIVRSRTGRAFQAIRDREIAASIIGVNLFRYKVAAFVISSAYAAIGGALLGSYLRFVGPSQFDLFLSIQYVAMIIIGGIGTVFGAILGAFFISLVPRLVEEFSDKIPFVATSATADGITVFELNQIIFGALIIVFLVAEPYGCAGLWRRAKIYFKTWPFSY